MMAEKLSAGQKHMLRLIVKDADAEGWAPVSAQVMPVVREMLPPELVMHESVGTEGRGRAKLTPVGESLLAAMEWL
jgi:hypothetical protein